MNISENNRNYSQRPLQGGLSLIELMISITIGLLILSSLTALFVNQSQIRSELDKTNRMIDNGRYALDVISENLRVAGFYGEPNSGVLVAGALPDPCSVTISDLSASIPYFIQGYNAASVSVAATSPPACIPASVKAGSDILVIRRVDTSNVGDSQSAITQASAVAAATSIPYVQISQCQYDTGVRYKVATTPASFTLRQRNCTQTSTTPYADLRRMIVQIYFIDSNNQPGDGIPTLKRIELSSAGAMTTVPLVEGIEYMQIDYGLDADADGNADSYIASPVTANWPNIMSAKLNIISRNIDLSREYTDTKTYALGLAGTYTPAAGDHYKRHAYTQLVRLVNPSGYRELP
jgi:type IV pilus assembly protein PilW